MSAADMFWAAPPVSRTITAAAVLLSVPVYIGLVEAYYVVMLPYKILTLRSVPQLWRLITPFFLTGPKLGMILDPYFLYNYGSMLEMQAMRFPQPGDFFIYVLFVASVIVPIGGFWLNGFSLLNPLSLAFAYTYAQEDPQRQINYFIITFSAKWLPLTMLLTTFVMASPGMAMVQASGLVAAHAYEFVMRIWPEYGGGRRLISTPVSVQRWFAQARGTPASRGFGTAFAGTSRTQGAQQSSGGGGSGWGSAFGGSAWGERGPGRTLGSD